MREVVWMLKQVSRNVLVVMVHRIDRAEYSPPGEAPSDCLSAAATGK